MLQSYAQTNIGQRKVNEDSFLINEELGLYIVADGVGGMAKGEVASQMACETVLHSIQDGMPLEESVYLAHRKIIKEMKSDKSKQGMATTLVAVLFHENSYEAAWVGDSRLYLWDGELKLLTKDDSYVELLLENGHIGIDELETHPDRNVISQALGIERKNISIHSNKGTLEKDQILLLCSDGLYGVANELNIAESLQSNDDIVTVTPELVDLAIKKQGKDNITLIGIKSSVNSTHTVKPKVFREFDVETGRIKGVEENHHSSASDLKNEQLDVETDPELINQTAYRDLTQENLDLLDSAAQSSAEDEKRQGNKYLIPILFGVILVLTSFILLK
jgi:protein phosphatase